eukprot:TRINITY_DN477_c16_g1_i1.p3 TRINITY_DN477_c16_g1~~TRINITY_DN477_c16_g1_i1.p3  ORF type:complete len:141 (+),score=12.53 TRINITY_DN477_c16_g1_i1:301-723(+)
MGLETQLQVATYQPPTVPPTPLPQRGARHQAVLGEKKKTKKKKSEPVWGGATPAPLRTPLPIQPPSPLSAAFLFLDDVPPVRGVEEEGRKAKGNLRKRGNGKSARMKDGGGGIMKRREKQKKETKKKTMQEKKKTKRKKK